MTKLLVRDDFCLVPGECLPAYDWYNPAPVVEMIINGWFHDQAIVGTDRYWLDVEHERTRTTPTND